MKSKTILGAWVLWLSLLVLFGCVFLEIYNYHLTGSIYSKIGFSCLGIIGILGWEVLRRKFFKDFKIGVGR